MWVEETDQVGSRGDRVGRQLGMEAQVGAPGLVDDERDPVLMGDAREGGDVGAGAEVGGGDDHGAGGLGRRRERRRQRLRGEAVGDAQLGVDLGGDEGGPQAGEDHAVDHRGVDVALDDDPVALVGDREAGGDVALRGAVDQEPGAPRPPGLGGEELGALEGSRLGADVDPLDQRGDVVTQPRGAGQLAQRRVGAGAALVARHVEAAGVAVGVGEERVQIGGLFLAGHCRRV